MAKRQAAKSKIELIAEAIAACRDASGRVVRSRVIEAARDPSSILHGEFEWDLKKAAMRDWERTAAELIRSVRYIIEYEDRKIAVPYYVSDPTRDESGYIATPRVARNSAMSERVLRDELDRITGAIRRAMKLAMACGLASSFERMLDEAVTIETRLDEIEDDGDDARA